MKKQMKIKLNSDNDFSLKKKTKKPNITMA